MSPVKYFLKCHRTQMQHKHFNTLLNNLKMASSQPDHLSSPLGYAHKHLVDSFYASDNPRDKDKIRVTRDEKTGTVIACMRKVRLGNLDIYSPKRAADWRISVNLEIPGASKHICFSTQPLSSFLVHSSAANWVNHTYTEERSHELHA